MAAHRSVIIPGPCVLERGNDPIGDALGTHHRGMLFRGSRTPEPRLKRRFEAKLKKILKRPKNSSKGARRDRTERLQVLLPAEELAAIDEFRFRAWMPSRAAAVRELLRRGLIAKRASRTRSRK
jgi:hypothetical protein